MRRRTKDHNILKGMLAGMVGGLVASWTMNQFQALEKTIGDAWQKNSHHARSADADIGNEISDDATMKTADRLSTLVTNRHLTKEQKKTGGTVVHYAYGTLLGGIYGALAEVTPLTRIGAGTGYATAAWVLGDEIAVPKLGLSGPPSQHPLKAHADAFASHIVYGLTTDAVQRGLRGVI